MLNIMYQDVNKASHQRRDRRMTKEMAIYLLRSKDVYLTSKGKKTLHKILSKYKKKKDGERR